MVGGTIFIIGQSHRWYIPWHLTIISGTLLLNLFFGFCPLTVWEEKLRRKYDYTVNLKNNFLATYIRSLLRVEVGQGFVFWGSLIVKSSAYIISILLLTVFKS